MTHVSIVVPAYNRPHLLRETLISCLIQTYRECEIIVVDDGSQADIGGVISQVCRDFDGVGRVRSIRQEHQGANAARNYGFAEATGELIQFVDSDDLLHPRKIEIEREALLDAPQIDMVFGLDEYFRRLPGDTGLLWNVAEVTSHLDRFLWDDPVWHTGSPLWRRSALERIGPWDKNLTCWQDWEFHIRALCRGIQYWHLPQVLQYIREHDDPRSTSLGSAQGRENSKLQAAAQVAEELRRASLWTSPRGDALAMFSLSIAANLTRARAWTDVRGSLDRAAVYAGSHRVRLIVGLLRICLPASRLLGSGRLTPLGTAYRLACRLGVLPRYAGHWRRIRSSSPAVPDALSQALGVSSNG